MEELWNNYLQKEFSLNEIDLRTYSPLTLAYIGDGIYELLIRTVLVCRSNKPANKLHKKASSIVKAGTQAAIAEYLIRQELLTEEEEAVYRRGRNAFSPTRAKNASMSDYRKATGLEALMGHLYLKGELARMVSLVQKGLEGTENHI